MQIIISMKLRIQRMQMKSYLLSLFFSIWMVSPVSAQVLLQESFDDANFSSRGWYDVGGMPISTTEYYGDSGGSLEMHFTNGSITPVGTGMRHALAESDRIYMRYAIKFTSSWTGSNHSYQPHMFYFLTNKEGRYAGPAETHLTAYVEQNEGHGRFGWQDTLNIDQSQIGVDLTNVTEARGVAGCNGYSDPYPFDCYSSGGHYRNGKWLSTADTIFENTPGPKDQTQWHIVEVYFQLNSIVGGKGVNDGIIKMWVDGNLVMNHNDLMLRTSLNSDIKFNQFLIGPYIGDGSPVDQTAWVDDLLIMDTMPVVPMPPGNLQVK
jgi:hypothetical protein